MNPRKWAAGGEVTYIAALRFPQFMVMSADTQESWNDEVCYEEKIEIERTAALDLVVGGAGRGELCEAFASHLFDSVRRVQPTTKEQIAWMLSDVLLSFYENDVRLFPSRGKATAFLIAARQASGELHLWKTTGMRTKEVSRFASVGRAHPFVQNMMRRLYRSDLRENQAVLLAIQIIASAKVGSRVIGGGPQVVFINKTGVYPEPDQHMAHMNSRFKELLPLVDKLVLAMPDLSLMESRFTKSLDEFREKIMQLRWDYKEELSKEMDKGNVNWPYERLPIGFTVIESTDDKGNVTMRVCSDPDDPDRETRALRLDDKGVLHFKVTTSIYISEKTYEHLQSCPSTNLRDCIQHIGQDC